MVGFGSRRQPPHLGKVPDSLFLVAGTFWPTHASDDAASPLQTWKTQVENLCYERLRGADGIESL